MIKSESSNSKFKTEQPSPARRGVRELSARSRLRGCKCVRHSVSHVIPVKPVPVKTGNGNPESFSYLDSRLRGSDDSSLRLKPAPDSIGGRGVSTIPEGDTNLRSKCPETRGFILFDSIFGNSFRYDFESRKPRNIHGKHGRKAGRFLRVP